MAPTGGDLPVNGVFSGSVCACNPNAIERLNNETKSDFFIVECRDARFARKQRDVETSDRINKMNKTASDNPSVPESTHSENSVHSVEENPILFFVTVVTVVRDRFLC